MKKATGKILSKVQAALKNPEVKENNKAKVRENAKESLLALLERNKEMVKQNDESGNPKHHKKQDIEL